MRLPERGLQPAPGPRTSVRRGLTTVEVFVASAIVIVFLAVAYPAARAMTSRAHDEACAEKIHRLGAALALYANDHDGWLPDVTFVERAYPGCLPPTSPRLLPC